MWVKFMVLPDTVVCSMPLTPTPTWTRAVCVPVVLLVTEAPVPKSAMYVPANQARLPSVMPMSKCVSGPLHRVLWSIDPPAKLNVCAAWVFGRNSGSNPRPRPGSGRGVRVRVARETYR
jgi:hypothetical protein